jgi:proline iminopeptidase
VAQPDERQVGLHPPQIPFDTGYLHSGPHRIYYEQCGNPSGIPVLFLHGGPGAGCAPVHRRLFDPQRYRVLLMDQRGSGRSEPHAGTEQNTTADLVADIETLRIRLGIDRLLLFGGSWGSTLALCYGLAHPHRVAGFVLRGIFLGSRAEVNWFLYEMGRFFPEAHARFLEPIDPAERGDLLAAYAARLNSADKRTRLAAARVWAAYENSCATLVGTLREAGSAALSMAVLEAHYFSHDCFLEDREILNKLERIRHLPAHIIQGRHDVICPPHTAWELARCWGPKARLRIIDDAGHSVFEAGILDQLLAALDDLASPDNQSEPHQP